LDKARDITRRLHHPEEEIRRQAIEELNRTAGTENLALLSEALGDASWRVRKTATDAIVHYPERQAAIATLVNALYDSDNVGRRTSAIEALVRIGDYAVDDLIGSYQTYDVDVRKFLIDIIGEIASRKSIPFLLRSISDADENVRLASVEALGKVGGEEAYEKLIALVSQSADMTIRFSALHILGRLGRPLPPDLVERLLKERMFRRAVFEVLGESPSNSGVDFLIEGVSDTAKSARQAAIRSLANAYEKDTTGIMRGRIEQGIKKVASNATLKGMVEFLDGNHYHTKRAAIKLLGLVDGEEVLHHLFQSSLDDTVSDELAAVFEKLSQTRQDWFKKLLAKEPEEIRGAVRRLLQEEEAISPLTAESHLELEDEEFETIRTRIGASYGMHFDPEMKYIIDRRVKQRMIVLRLTRTSDYLALLEDSIAGRDELYRLVNLLATNETYFFREDFQLKTFGEEILPELCGIARKEHRDSIKIWSAGCSSGEEPYTIGMLIAERNDVAGLKFEIYGSDLSEQMIEKAKKGIYSASSFRVIERYFFEKYFQPSEHQHMVKDEIKDRVKFDNINLLSYNYPSYLKNVDVVFCRNVLIYFSLEARRAVVDRFYQVLRPGGFLLLGHSESLMNLSTAFQLRHFKHDMVYQKPSLGEKDWKKS
jgi:chemotaxis protein methyltransferase CheR